MTELYIRRQKELERIRSEGDRVMQEQWKAFYSALPLEDVKQLLYGERPHGHSAIEHQSPEHRAAAAVWREKSEHIRNNLSKPSVNLKTLDVGGNVHNDDWRSKTPE